MAERQCPTAPCHGSSCSFQISPRSVHRSAHVCSRVSLSLHPFRLAGVGGLALFFRAWHSSMQLFLTSILLASGFSLSTANTTGPAPVQFLEQSTQAATPRRLTHRRTVDGPPPRACVGVPAVRARASVLLGVPAAPLQVVSVLRSSLRVA